MAVDHTVFSEYEVRQMNFRLDGDVYEVPCIGKLEEESEVKVITKKCRGVVKKTRTRGTGSGTLKVTAHLPYELYARLQAMDVDGLVDGVYAYGDSSLHPEFLATADVFDEDDVEKFKAWPRCVMSTGPARTVENGGDEVAEVEAEISFMPDENGQGMYEALKSKLTAEVASTWLKGFTTALVTDTTGD